MGKGEVRWPGHWGGEEAGQQTNGVSHSTWQGQLQDAGKGQPPGQGTSKPSTAGQATVYALLPTQTGPILAPPPTGEGMLEADWTCFLELVSYALGGHTDGRVAFGLEECAAAVDQAAVAVLFVSAASGTGGEQAVREAVGLGARGYIVGHRNAFYEDIDDWGAAALLRAPLEVLPPPQELFREIEPPAKRPRLDALSAATAKAAPALPPSDLWQAAGPAPEADERPAVQASARDLRHSLKSLGRLEALKDAQAIPQLAEAVRERYLPGLGPDTVFKAFLDIFKRAKGEAHRKSIIYVVYELFMSKRGVAMKLPERRMSCLEHFLLPLGPLVQTFRSHERQAYVVCLSRWSSARVLLPAELAQIKDAWDMD